MKKETKGKSNKKLSEEESKKLLEYYRDRMDKIQKERIEWMKNLEGININVEDFHEKEWELKELTDKIIEYQQSLSEANIALNNERKRNIAFTNEIENYKINTKNDRKKISQLLELNEPFNTQTYYDRRPEKQINNKINNKNSVSLNKCINKKERLSPWEVKQDIIKSLMFPKEDNNNDIEDENKYLNIKKEEIKLIYENMIYRLKEDNKLRDEEIRLHTINMNKKIKELENRKNNLENENYILIRDYMDLKYDNNINNNKINNELEIIKLENSTLKDTLNKLENKIKVESKINSKEYNRKTKDMTNRLRNQIKNKEQINNLALQQYNDIQELYNNKINQIKNKYKNVESKYLLLKNNYDNDNNINDNNNTINELRNKMKIYENYIFELKKLTRGDYDHYKNIQNKTDINNEQFLNDTNQTYFIIQQFLQNVRQAQKNNKKFLDNLNKQYDDININNNNLDNADNADNNNQDNNLDNFDNIEYQENEIIQLEPQEDY